MASYAQFGPGIRDVAQLAGRELGDRARLTRSRASTAQFVPAQELIRVFDPAGKAPVLAPRRSPR